MILVDWTRMGKTFCVAGVVAEVPGWRTVRPLPVPLRTPSRPRAGLRGVIEALISGPKNTAAPSDPPLPRNVGWFSNRLARVHRWDIVELMYPHSAEIEPPHTEDLWVCGLRPTGRSATLEERAAILRATSVRDTQLHFGVPLLTTRTSAYLRPGMGERSLVTVMVPSKDVCFVTSEREGAGGAEVRVNLRVPQVGTKLLPVKDHPLLCHAEQAAPGDLGEQAKVLRQAILQMGPTVAVRLGLSRGYDSGRGEPRCWLMADGFFPTEVPSPSGKGLG